jgi:hypothetical protein
MYTGSGYWYKSKPGRMKKTNPFNYLLPRIKDVVFVTIFLGVLILGNQMLNADGDLPRHLATGRLILETGHVPMVEPFVYPYLGEPYVPHEWLFGVICFIVYKYLGLTGIVLGSAFVIAATFTILYNHLSKKTGLYLPLFLLVIWGALASSLHWITRPHLFTMLFLAIWLVWMDQLKSGGPLRLWKFLILMLLWCNLHAEFIMGILITIAFIVGWLLETLMESQKADPAIGKRMLIVLAASIPATLVNPAGYLPWMRVFRYLGNDYLMSSISETNSPNFQRPEFLVLLALIIFSIILLARNTRKITWVDSLLLAGATMLTLTSARSVHLYGIIAPFSLSGALLDLKSIPLVARFEGVLIRVDRQLRIYFATTLVLLISLAVLLLGRMGNFYQFDPSIFPVRATEWLKDQPQTGNVFNEFDWGGYLVFNGKPGQLVFLDSMSDHSGDLTRAYEQAITPGGDWQPIFDRYQIQWAIIPRSSILSLALQQAPGWHVIYLDDTAIIISHAIN